MVSLPAPPSATAAAALDELELEVAEEPVTFPRMSTAVKSENVDGSYNGMQVILGLIGLSAAYDLSGISK